MSYNPYTDSTYHSAPNTPLEATFQSWDQLDEDVRQQSEQQHQQLIQQQQDLSAHTSAATSPTDHQHPQLGLTQQQHHQQLKHLEENGTSTAPSTPTAYGILAQTTHVVPSQLRRQPRDSNPQTRRPVSSPTIPELDPAVLSVRSGRAHVATSTSPRADSPGSAVLATAAGSGPAASASISAVGSSSSSSSLPGGGAGGGGGSFSSVRRSPTSRLHHHQHTFNPYPRPQSAMGTRSNTHTMVTQAQGNRQVRFASGSHGQQQQPGLIIGHGDQTSPQGTVFANFGPDFDTSALTAGSGHLLSNGLESPSLPTGPGAFPSGMPAMSRTTSLPEPTTVMPRREAGLSRPVGSAAPSDQRFYQPTASGSGASVPLPSPIMVDTRFAHPQPPPLVPLATPQTSIATTSSNHPQSSGPSTSTNPTKIIYSIRGDVTYDIRNKILIMTLELPGVRKQDLSITLGTCLYNGVRQITISGTTSPRFPVEENPNALFATHMKPVRERKYGEYSRIFAVPNETKYEDIDAELTDGLLILRVQCPSAPDEVEEPLPIVVRHYTDNLEVAPRSS